MRNIIAEINISRYVELTFEVCEILQLFINWPYVIKDIPNNKTIHGNIGQIEQKDGSFIISDSLQDIEINTDDIYKIRASNTLAKVYITLDKDPI